MCGAQPTTSSRPWLWYLPPSHHYIHTFILHSLSGSWSIRSECINVKLKKLQRCPPWTGIVGWCPNLLCSLHSVAVWVLCEGMNVRIIVTCFAPHFSGRTSVVVVIVALLVGFFDMHNFCGQFKRMTLIRKSHFADVLTKIISTHNEWYWPPPDLRVSRSLLQLIQLLPRQPLILWMNWDSAVRFVVVRGVA